MVLGQSKAYKEFTEDNIAQVTVDFLDEIDFWKDEEYKGFKGRMTRITTQNYWPQPA
jgi:hypothetical protein